MPRWIRIRLLVVFCSAISYLCLSPEEDAPGSGKKHTAPHKMSDTCFCFEKKIKTKKQNGSSSGFSEGI
uniref:Putative secreted protein n=1 Tax=Anopheles triannulatus TaxID=58253 RepID=A0A2M4B7J1_9DIPT